MQEILSCGRKPHGSSHRASVTAALGQTTALICSNGRDANGPCATGGGERTRRRRTEGQHSGFAPRPRALQRSVVELFGHRPDANHGPAANAFTDRSAADPDRSGDHRGSVCAAMAAVVMLRHGSFFTRFTASFMWNSSPLLSVFNSFQSTGRAIGAPLRARVE